MTGCSAEVPSSRIRSWVSPSLRWCTTTWPAKASTSSSRTAGSWGTRGTHCSGAVGADRRDADLEVRAGRVVQDQEHVPAAQHAVVEAVLQPLAAPGEELPAGAGGVRVEVVVLAGGLGPRRDHQEAVGAGAADAHPEPAVGLVEDQLVLGLGGAEPVPPDLVGAPGVVDGRVVEVGALAVPGGTPDDAGDLVGQQLSAGEVLDTDRVALVAGDVGGVGQQAGVRAHRGAAEREEVVPLGERVQVQQQLLARERGLGRRAVLGRLRRGPVVLAADRDPAAGAVLAGPRRSASSTSGRGSGWAPRGRSRGCGP